jgi:hypothetical protein
MKKDLTREAIGVHIYSNSGPNPKLIIITYILPQSRDSSIGITTGYGLDDRMIEVRFPAGAGNFSL